MPGSSQGALDHSDAIVVLGLAEWWAEAAAEVAWWHGGRGGRGGMVAR